MHSNINVFISYSWDSPTHQHWVLSLADLINSKGGNAIVDRTHLPYGGHIKTFMLKSILEANVVLIILTPAYKNKADSLQGGAGYEYNIINDQLFKVIQTNDKFIPILREGTQEKSITLFLQGFNYVDLRNGNEYDNNLTRLLKQVLKIPVKILSQRVKTSNMEREYKDINLVAAEMKKKAYLYFKQIFVTENPAITKLKVKTRVNEWEEEIQGYHNSFTKVFSPEKMKIYEDHLEDFKNKIFAKELWTVKAALKTPDPDLARYKKDYRDADVEVIFETVKRILEKSRKYSASIATRLNYANLENVKDLKMEYLDEEDMSMNKVIGFGIRSEILHRYFPAYFPIMTQPSLWAMYFICESDNEFITIEQRTKDNIMRVSHNWQYPYERFTFLMNIIANELSKWMGEYGVTLQPDLRFGYVNMFLTTVKDLHKADIKLLHEWVEND